MQNDWRDQGDGIIPPPRYAAMIDWVQAAHPDWYEELRQITHTWATTGTPESDQAFERRLEELRAIWRKAGQPDPRGRLLHRPGGPAGQIQH